MAGTLTVGQLIPDVGTNLYLNAQQYGGNVVIGNATTQLFTFGTGSTLTANVFTANTVTSNTVTATSVTANVSSATVTTTALNISGVGIGAGNASIMKNRIINGAMVIDQRNAGASVTATTGQLYSLDRWKMFASVNSKYTVQQNAGSITPPAGYTNYLGVTSSSAYSVGAGDYFFLAQIIEGYNIADLNFGTANAETVTLSFQVYSSLTGTFGGALSSNGYGRSYAFTYTVSTPNTWTPVTVTIAGDTTGTWLTNNGIGLQVFFGLGIGSNYTGAAGSWQSTAYFGANSAVSVVGTNGATFYITGVQLEVGSSATGFEYRQYGQELQLCQRYYQLGAGFTAGWAAGSTTMGGIASLGTTMRAAPTATLTNTGAPPGANYSGSPSAGTTTTTYIPVTWGTNGLSQNAYGIFTYTASAEL